MFERLRNQCSQQRQFKFFSIDGHMKATAPFFGQVYRPIANGIKAAPPMAGKDALNTILTARGATVAILPAEPARTESA